MLQASIRIKTLDGTETKASTKTFMATADRVAFERHFDIPAMHLQKYDEAFDDDGNPREGADLSELREEWMYFLAWRALRREVEGLPEFDPFLESLSVCHIDVGGRANGQKRKKKTGEGEAPRPTDQAPRPG